MARLGHGLVVGDNLSRAWLETTKMVRQDGGKAFHTVTRIADPLLEDADIRAGHDALLHSKRKPSAETVANTIFPAAMAAAAGSPEELVQRYLDSYPQMRRFKPNAKGTYFGRIVAHPTSAGEQDQLVRLIDTLRDEAAARTPMSARYEVGVADVPPGIEELEVADRDDAADRHVDADAGADDLGGADIPVFAPRRDTSRRGFPCLSLLSFQLDGHTVHLFAHYRYEYLVEKGYGNYLGLARLLEYIATEAGLKAGQMTIAAGRVQADASERALAIHLGPLWESA
jgi:hypothetical protein